MRAAPGGDRIEMQLVMRVTAAGLLVATGAIHLDLYVTEHRTIPTIGWLFLLQVIAAFGLGALVLMVRSRLAATAGAGLALSTLGGYLLSLRIGLFGFREGRTEVGTVAGIIEVVAFAVLAYLALGANGYPSLGPVPRKHRLLEGLRVGIPHAGWAVGPFRRSLQRCSVSRCRLRQRATPMHPAPCSRFGAFTA